jgi:hypothetical protein
MMRMMMTNLISPRVDVVTLLLLLLLLLRLLVLLEPQGKDVKSPSAFCARMSK